MALALDSETLTSSSRGRLTGVGALVVDAAAGSVVFATSGAGAGTGAGTGAGAVADVWGTVSQWK